MAPTSFQGFPKEAFAFLKEIKTHNNKTWFEKHKEAYVENVVEPGQALVEVLGPRLQKVAKTVQYDSSASGHGSVKRIYRDVRFSKDKKPYKDYFGLIFWDGKGSKKEVPSFGLHVEQDGGWFFAGMHGFPTKEVRETYRKMVDNERTGKELQRIVDGIRKTRGYEVGGSELKNVPREFDPEHPRAELLKHNGLWALSPKITVAQLKSPKLVSQCAAYAKKTAPLEQWLVKLWKKAS